MNKETGALIGVTIGAALAKEVIWVTPAIAGEPLNNKNTSKIVTPEKGKGAPKIAEIPKPVEKPAIDWSRIRQENPAPKVVNRQIPETPKNTQPIPYAPKYSAEEFGVAVVNGIATVMVWAWNLVTSIITGIGKGLYEVTIKQPVVGVILDIIALVLGFKIAKSIWKKIF